MKSQDESNTKNGNKIAGITTYLSILTLNVNDLNSLPKDIQW
jgi:hypothetical protein